MNGTLKAVSWVSNPISLGMVSPLVNASIKLVVDRHSVTLLMKKKSQAMTSNVSVVGGDVVTVATGSLVATGISVAATGLGVGSGVDIRVIGDEVWIRIGLGVRICVGFAVGILVGFTVGSLVAGDIVGFLVGFFVG